MKLLLCCAGAVMVSMGLGACAATPLPTYDWQTPEQALAIMHERDRQVRTVQAVCVLKLTGNDGATRTLDGAIVIQPPNLRMRAWKFDKAVFDVTSTPEGLWLLADDRVDLERVVDAAALARGLELLSPGVTRQTAASDAQVLPDRSLRLRLPDGVATVRGDTLLICRLEISTGPSGDPVNVTLTYRQYGEHVWMHHVTVHGSFGVAQISFRDVDINSEPGPRAFVPPRRAVKQ